MITVTVVNAAADLDSGLFFFFQKKIEKTIIALEIVTLSVFFLFLVYKCLMLAISDPFNGNWDDPEKNDIIKLEDGNCASILNGNGECGWTYTVSEKTATIVGTDIVGTLSNDGNTINWTNGVVYHRVAG